ncbi:MAG: glycosyltransferase family 2 protein [Ignavibacteriales bacterium]|nr:glycosyltransferase family 2 protein [Ignavibacteriales bacterium]
MNRLVSVIVPVYNRVNLIQSCIDSLLDQSYKPVEIIVVDDGSDDGTVEYLEQNYGTKINLVKYHHTGLPAVVRNIGITHASGEYIAFCDSDDRWLPEKLQMQMQRLNETQSNLSCSDGYINNIKGERYLHGYIKKYADDTKELCWNNFIITSSVVVEKALLKNKRFSANSLLRGYEDYHLWLSLVNKLKIDYVGAPLLIYGKNSEGLSAEFQTQDSFKQLLVMLYSIQTIRYPIIWIKKLLKYIYHMLK